MSFHGFLISGQRSTNLWHWKCTTRLPLSFAWLASSTSRKLRSQRRRSSTGELLLLLMINDDPSANCQSSNIKVCQQSWFSGVSKVSSNSPWSWKAICSPALQWFSAIWMLRLVPISQSPKKSINILHILYSYQPCFHLQVPGHSERIDQLWVQLRQQLINNSEEI